MTSKLGPQLSPHYFPATSPLIARVPNGALIDMVAHEKSQELVADHNTESKRMPFLAEASGQVSLFTTG